MKKQFLRGLWLLLTVFLVVGLTAGCESRSTSDSGKGGVVTVGSKNFTENIIMGEMMAQVIEAKTDLKVNRKLNLGGTLVCWQGLKKGELDFYPDYTGTGLMAILKRDVITDPDEVYRIVQEEYNKQFKIKWLEPFGFNDTYAIAVREEFAEQNNLKTISDLKPYAKDLIFCAEQEFYNRKDGFPGFSETYGLTFKETKAMETSLKYKAVADKKADVIDAFSTDGELISYRMTILEDDKHFFPPYYCAPVVRMDTLEKYPELESALNSLGGKISEADMQQMNYLVKEKGEDPAKVAADFLKNKGIL
ncbi:Substrate-binding region of ABC-type glycine betaine transport system [Syntrophothermus lipocalidus DSM 12680]|uniref:Substrate-binding region of ABC-type glycine betaine transport system n=1 Tax=Syntrophothermus lipocalidus (strain DSM 12680 / TGB-C1) TaxID=643648 RepID=D7CL32_SYNLT|nr:Substrate-binding region of ABC-type glycine betaine transport system [Syntrophothermus lipocalidus DSM 12680]